MTFGGKDTDGRASEQKASGLRVVGKRDILTEKVSHTFFMILQVWLLFLRFVRLRAITQPILEAQQNRISQLDLLVYDGHQCPSVMNKAQYWVVFSSVFFYKKTISGPK